MNIQNIEQKSNNKGFLNIILGLIIGVVLVTGYFKVSNFLEARKIDKRVLENNINKYNISTGEPTDLPPYKGNDNTTTNNTTNNNNNVTTNGNSWNGKTLIGIEEAKKIAIDTIGGGEVIYQEEDIYDIEDLPTYDFKIKNGNKVYEIEIDALTGAVLDYDID